MPKLAMQTSGHLVTVSYTPGDGVAEALAKQCKRYRCEPLGEATLCETVCLLSDERLLPDDFPLLQAPNFRLLALSLHDFHSPQLHKAVYAYLPPQTPPALVTRMVDNAISHMRLMAACTLAKRQLEGVIHEISELNKIGTALSAEHDVQKLLELILTKSREITQADAGSLYIIEGDEETGEEPASARGADKRLRFRVAQNDSINIPFHETTMAIDDSSIAGYVALHGKTVLLDDCYNIDKNLPYHINRKFDAGSGYRTKSILAVPMHNPDKRIVGVVQLINAKRHWKTRLDSPEAIEREVVPFNEMQREIVLSLASQAAVAYENSRLYQNIQKLFEGFVKASVVVIESRDPATSGHSFRVANMTVALAEFAARDEKEFAGVNFTRAQMREIRFASLLHDFGKVGVREQVLVKAKKLYPEQKEALLQRFETARQSLLAVDRSERLNFVLQHGRDSYEAEAENFNHRMQTKLAGLEETLEFVLSSNEPSVLPEGKAEQLAAAASLRYIDGNGHEQPLLTYDEIRQLSIRKGSLDPREREEIESHVMRTFNFLRQIPWTPEIRNIPQIALAHHEKLNGTGYPRRLKGKEIPLQSRMMTIADIFDALAAVDRPYKKAVPAEKALDILRRMVKDGELDGALVRLFCDAKVYERWQVEPHNY